MRTTVEITHEHYLALTGLAARRGIRGFSPLVREALDLYLAERGPTDLEAALALEGTLSEEEAAEARRRIAESWTTWPKVS